MSSESTFCPHCGSRSVIRGSYSDSPLLSPTPDSGAQGMTMASQPELAEGTELLDFRIGPLLGKGASSAVYKAHQTLLDESVALKVVASFSEEHPLLEAYTDEYKAQLSIVNKAHILHCETPRLCNHQNMNWLMLPMELARESFRDWMNRHPVVDEKRLEQGVELFRQACLGVQAIHEAGLVHLDLKPENLLITGDQENPIVKVADFGLTRSRMSHAQRGELFDDGIGTPAYMAPEQIRSAHWKDVGVLADIYALGMILFELLDGDLPYSGTAKEIKEKKLDTGLKIRTPQGPLRLQTIAKNCISNSANERPVAVKNLLLSIDLDSNLEEENLDKIKESEEKLWYERDTNLFESEKSEMTTRYPQFKIGKLDDDRLFWHGKIKSKELEKEWYLQVVYEKHFGEADQKSNAIKIYSIEPDLDDLIYELGTIPYITKDSNSHNYIDVFSNQSDDLNEKSIGAVTYLTRAEKWINLFESWLEDQIETNDFMIGL